MSHYDEMEEYNPNQIEEEFIIDGDSVTKETYQSFKALERQLAEAREAEKKAFWSALNITDKDFNSRDTGGNCFDEVKQIFWDEYQEQLKEQG